VVESLSGRVMRRSAIGSVPAVAASYLLPDDPCRTVAEYRAAGQGDAVAIAEKQPVAALLDVLTSAGLRTRDHAATSLAAKWRDLAAGASPDGDRYLVADGTDSEPGSFTDRALLRANPLGVIEGVAVAARVLGAREAFVAIRRSFATEYESLTSALAEAEMAGWLDHVSIKCVRTPDSYLVGDHRALLECIEGRAAIPDRDDAVTLFDPANTATVESLETLVNVAAIAVNGARWFRSMGTAVSPGNILCTITGDVARHGVVEAELGRRLSDVIEQGGGGFTDGAAPKAVLSGVSSPVLTRSRLAAPLCWEGLAAVGADLGRAAFMVYGESTDMFAVAHQIAAYLYVESCGLCPACKFGGGEVTAYLARLVAGTGDRRDLEALGGRLATVDDRARCALAGRLRDVVSSIVWAFPGGVPDGTSPALPSVLRPLLDIADGVAVYDDRQDLKRPDGELSEHPVKLTRW